MKRRAISLITAVLGRRLVTVTVRGRSMEPSFHEGDRVLVLRDTAPRTGEVVVAEEPEVVIGRRTPEPVLIWRNSVVPSRTGAAVIRPRRWIIKRVAAVAGDSTAGVVVPEGKLVLLGDNRGLSLDSRQMGYFPAERVLGVVCLRLPPGGESPNRRKGSGPIPL